MKLESVEARTELLMRRFEALQRRMLALQAITLELAGRCDLSEGDGMTLAAELSARFPPEIAPSLRDEIARLVQS